MNNFLLYNLPVVITLLLGSNHSTSFPDALQCNVIVVQPGIVQGGTSLLIMCAAKLVATTLSENM